MPEFPASLGETNAATDAEPTVVDLGADHADELFDALSAGTARGLFQRLQESPAHASTLAEHTDTSVQNVHYHLDKLEAAGAIEVVDTAYSTKGREMDVYAPTASPLVFVADGDDGVAESLSKFLGALGLLALGSVLVQALLEALFYPGGPTPVDGGGSYAAPPLTNVAPPIRSLHVRRRADAAGRLRAVRPARLPPGRRLGCRVVDPDEEAKRREE